MLIECFGNKPSLIDSVKILAALGTEVGSNSTKLARRCFSFTLSAHLSGLFKNGFDRRAR